MTRRNRHAVVEYVANLCIVTLTVAACHEHLCAHAEPHAEHEHGNVEYTAERGSTEFHFAHTSEECGVGHADELFHEHADEDGEGYGPYLPIGVGMKLLHKAGVFLGGGEWWV